MLAISIPSFEQKGDDQLFLVRVARSRDAQNTYTVKRQYKHFEALHTTLKAAFNGVPTFTPKRGTLKKPEDIEKRREGLSLYLRSVTGDAALVAVPDVRSFLELNAAEQLFAVLKEKDEFDTANLAVKDEALADSRSQLAKSQSEAGTLKNKLGLAEAELETAAGQKAALEGQARRRTRVRVGGKETLEQRVRLPGWGHRRPGHACVRTWGVGKGAPATTDFLCARFAARNAFGGEGGARRPAARCRAGHAS